MPAAPELLAELPAATALQMLRAGESLRNYHIVGRLELQKLATDDVYCPCPITLEHCQLNYMQGVMLQYQGPVILRHCHFNRADFAFAYFLQGLLIEDCVFEGYLDFQAGGHNKSGFPVRLLRNTFQGFVNFFDCWYEAEVQIEHNDFQGETNLLSFSVNYMEFNVPP